VVLSLLGGAEIAIMRLVFLHGPPAVGKLTVARELAARTGFKLLHNHLTIDLVAAVFPFGSEPYKRLINRFRRDLIAESAREGVDLIFTFVYSAHEDDDLVRELIEPVQASGGTVLFVRLTCATPELLLRVQSDSRRAFGKLTDPDDLSAVLRRYNFGEAVPFGENLEIDTTNLLPAEAVVRIIDHYSLPDLTDQ
jgi:hypothetical protein